MDFVEKENFDVKSLTSFKIGGKVSCAYFPSSQKEFVELLQTLESYIVLGNCSNVLISSDGFDGNIIFTSNMKDYFINGNVVQVSCGVSGPLISQKAAEKALSGFEFMIGFPGSIGGEIYMNASAHGQAISDNLKNCCLFNLETKSVEYKEKSNMEFAYRTSLLQKGNYILLGAEFELNRGIEKEIKNLMARNLESRKSVQPNLVNPNAGSVFKNPANDSAGRLLDKAGVKAFEYGGAKVWQNHANFIVNSGNATSEDVLNLMLMMKNEVQKQFTIELEPEIIYIGNKNRKEEELCKMLYKKMPK